MEGPYQLLPGIRHAVESLVGVEAIHSYLTVTQEGYLFTIDFGGLTDLDIIAAACNLADYPCTVSTKKGEQKVTKSNSVGDLVALFEAIVMEHVFETRGSDGILRNNTIMFSVPVLLGSSTYVQRPNGGVDGWSPTPTPVATPTPTGTARECLSFYEVYVEDLEEDEFCQSCHVCDDEVEVQDNDCTIMQFQTEVGENT